MIRAMRINSFPRLAAGLMAAVGLALPLRAATLCTLIVDAADGQVLLTQGDCRTRVTPASTFKIPLAVMGFDAGFLASEHTPVLNIRPGDPEWGGEPWRQPTDPTRWMKYSVVWYSQRITHALGAAKLHDYAARFGYGNADFSGDAGFDNGLERAWIISSLQVSPQEQVEFLRKLVNRTLPVSPRAIDLAQRVVEVTRLPDGREVHGKTGTAFPRRADRSFDEARAYGWYVGWASEAGRTLVFARLNQDERQEAVSGGLRARADFLKAWPALVAALSAPSAPAAPARPASPPRP
jgi:beta-lactamase class D